MLDLIDEMSELVYVSDVDTYDLLFLNSAGKRSVGIDSVKGIKCYAALQGKDHPCEFCTNSKLSEDSFYTWEFTNEHLNCSYLLRDKLIDWEGKKVRLEIAIDTTEQELQKKALEKLSYSDGLTGLLNRNAFNRDLQILAQTLDGPVGILYLNLNGMKEINDQHGHAYGDDMICKVAQAVSKTVHSDRVYRIDGDEFLVLYAEIAELQFDTELRTLRKALFERTDFQVAIGQRWSASCSDVDKLVSDANEQMYVDKKTYYYCNAAPKRYRHGNDDILQLTQPGVLEKLLVKGQFIVYIQPKVSVDNRSLIGAEALIRFQSHDGSLVMPDSFIPLLEETRLISKVDFFVFKNMCAKIKEWIEQGKKVVPISVNFSRYSLTENQFANRLHEIWERYQIPKELIEVEITESMSEDEGNAFLEVAKSVRDLGFVIAIDDFGVKHANVSLFTLLKFDVLKIDKILITNLQEDEISQIVLQGISDVCRKMGIQLIVEGVETEQQFAVLKLLRCEGAQGYLIDRPLPMQNFEQKYISFS